MVYLPSASVLPTSDEADIMVLSFNSSVLELCTLSLCVQTGGWEGRGALFRVNFKGDTDLSLSPHPAPSLSRLVLGDSESLSLLAGGRRGGVEKGRGAEAGSWGCCWVWTLRVSATGPSCPAEQVVEDMDTLFSRV